MTERHVHIISFDIPCPPNYGGAIDVYYKIKALAAEGVKIHLHCYEYGRKKSDKLLKYCSTVKYYHRQVSKTKLLSQLPYIVVTRADHQLVNDLLETDYPLLFEGLHTTFFLNDDRLKGRRKIVRTHNVEHDYYQGLADAEKNIFKKYYFSNEASKLKRFEKILKHADGVAAISENDRVYFSRKYKNVHKVIAFHPNEEVKILSGKGNFVLYHGSLSVAENNEAALFLLNNVFNTLDIPLIIAGSDPSPQLKQTASKFSHVKLIPDVSTDELHSLVKNAQINVLPTFQATGIKLKLLSALFTGRHCVVNEPMVKNTGLESLCTVANDPEQMKKAVAQVFNLEFSPEKIEERKIVLEEEFSNHANVNRLMKMLF